jgi:GNAT superfamily N-acetyltransferase
MEARMALRIDRITASDLPAYAAIPTAFTVESVYRVDARDAGLAGLAMVEERVEPYVKDYDALPDEDDGDDEGVVGWAAAWDVTEWGIFLATDDGQAVGGVAVAVGAHQHVPTDGLHEGVLYDIRVRPDRRREGIGAGLFAHAADWARGQGLARLRIETQNVNVPACRFYASQGCDLGVIHRYGYRGHPGVGHEAMLLWYLTL